MRAIDIVAYLAQTHFKRERGDCNTLLPNEGYKWISYEALNIIVYCIDVEYYKRYKHSAVSYEEDMLVCLSYGPVYDSTIKNLPTRNPQTNMLDYLSREDFNFREEIKPIIDNKLISVIDDVYAFIYKYLGEYSDRRRLYSYFKLTKLYLENHIRTDIVREAVNVCNKYPECFDLSFLLLAFKEKYKFEMIHYLMEEELEEDLKEKQTPVSSMFKRLKEEILNVFNI